MKYFSATQPSLSFMGIVPSAELNLINKIVLKQFNENLSDDPNFKKYFPNHHTYVFATLDESLRYAGNSFANFFRGHGVDYPEMLSDVLKNKFNYSVPSGVSVERMEQILLSKVFYESCAVLEKTLTQEEQEKIISEFDPSFNLLNYKGQITLTSFLALFEQGGFLSYQILLRLSNAFHRLILGKGLSIFSTAALTKIVS